MATSHEQVHRIRQQIPLCPPLANRGCAAASTACQGLIAVANVLARIPHHVFPILPLQRIPAPAKARAPSAVIARLEMFSRATARRSTQGCPPPAWPASPPEREESDRPTCRPTAKRSPTAATRPRPPPLPSTCWPAACPTPARRSKVGHQQQVERLAVLFQRARPTPRATPKTASRPPIAIVPGFETPTRQTRPDRRRFRCAASRRGVARPSPPGRTMRRQTGSAAKNDTRRGATAASRVKTAPNTQDLANFSFADFANHREESGQRSEVGGPGIPAVRFFLTPDLRLLTSDLFCRMAAAANGLLLQSIVTDMLVEVELVATLPPTNRDSTEVSPHGGVKSHSIHTRLCHGSLIATIVHFSIPLCRRPCRCVGRQCARSNYAANADRRRRFRNGPEVRRH